MNEDSYSMVKKILIITYRYPFKNGPHCSFGQSIFYEAFKTQFEVKGICFGDRDETDDNFVTIKRSSNIVKKIFNLIFLVPIRQTHYQSKSFHKTFEDLLSTYKPDLIYVEHTVTAQYIESRIPDTKVVFFDDESMFYVKANKLIKTLKERIKNLFMERAEKKSHSNK